MQVKGIDHVNIIAADLDETVDFYGQLLGLRRGETPFSTVGVKGAWLLDAADHAVIHLMTHDRQRHGDGARGPATGAIDHVAFACQDFPGVLARCEAMGLNHRVNELPSANFRQIFVKDPNDVALELNFAQG